MDRENMPDGPVFVGLSGGVDSSVAALLLKESGISVVGAFIETWQPDFLPCSQEEDKLEAKRVAATLDIPFTLIDARDAYKEKVIDHMLAAYAEGNTPNPDIWCNREIKFGIFMEAARKHGAWGIATGHYAARTIVDNAYALMKATDTTKDQTYFLWTLTQNDLAHTLFPLGYHTKQDVRAMARHANLPTAQKKDSQGLCFLGPVDMRAFLTHFLKPTPGAVLDETGAIIGTHPGALLFTLGERHGFTVRARKVDAKPLYVVDKNVTENTITVSEAPRTLHGGATTQLTMCNWIRTTPREGQEVFVRYRHRQVPIRGEVTESLGQTVCVSFKAPQLIAPGQSVVLYTDGECLGGGYATSPQG